MPTFLLNTWSMPADVDHACDYALVDIWPSTARQLLVRHEAFAAMRARDAQLYEISYWDYLPRFFTCAEMPEAWAMRADREETIQLPEAPLELVHDIIVWEEPDPTDAEMLRITRRLYEAAQRVLPDAEGLRRIFAALRGLPAFTIEQALALSLTASDLDFEQLWQQKVQCIRSTHGLSFSTGRETFADIGGLDQAKRAMALRFQGPQPLPRG